MDPVEIELKFQVPAAARAGVRRALATATAQTVHLRAAYFDTADQRLAAAGLALRLRQEGRRWVQTLKSRGDGVMERLEHEVVLPAQRGVPTLDPARHADTPVGRRLLQLLADGTPLQERYRTEMQRLLRRVRSSGATVEIAFDSGRIAAGAVSLPVCELEFELVAGPPQPLLALADRWVQRHGLWLDVRTKSERGHRLGLGLSQVPATAALPMRLAAGASPAQAVAAMLQAALAQALPNAAELGAGSGTAEHLHQLRVALRRLRTVLRLLAPWSADAATALALERSWREPFQRLGTLRDADVLATVLAPAFASVDAPPWTAPASPAGADPAAVVHDPRFTQLLLQTLQLALAEPPAAQPPLAEAAAALLKPAWRHLRADAAAFASAAAPERHRLRRRMKWLRYAMEFLLPVLPAKPSRQALEALREALDALGASNDVQVALDLLRTLPEPGAAIWFARGWLLAQQAPLERRTLRRLAPLADLRRFWR